MRRLEFEEALVRAAEALGQAKAEKEQIVQQVARRVEFSKRWGSWQPRGDKA